MSVVRAYLAPPSRFTRTPRPKTVKTALLACLTEEPVAHIRRKVTHAVGQLAGVSWREAQVGGVCFGVKAWSIELYCISRYFVIFANVKGERREGRENVRYYGAAEIYCHDRWVFFQSCN